MRRIATAVAITLCAGACSSSDRIESTDSTPAPAAVADASVTTASSESITTASNASITTASNASITTVPAADTAPPSVQPCADVVGATVDRSGESYRFDVTVSSGDTGWEKYADSWVVRDADGTVLGERILLHPHVDEQPFTRSLSGVVLPDDVDEVVIAARDSVNGFCGEVFVVRVGR